MQIYHSGNLLEAEENLHHILDWGTSDGGHRQAFTGTAHILLAEIALERNQLDKAANFVKIGVELIQQGGISYSLTHTYCTKARLCLALGDGDGAVEALRLAKQASLASPLTHILIHYLSCQGRLSLQIEDIETALLWAEGRQSDLPDKIPTYLYEVKQISLARANLAVGNIDETLEILDQIQPRAESTARHVHVIDIQILKALALQERREMDAATNAMQNALSYAAPEGYLRKFLEAGEPVFRLLQSTPIQNTNSKFANSILVNFGLSSEEPKPTIQPVRWSPTQTPPIMSLTNRECEILKLISAGYTNQQIADELIITLNTVKKHTTHIFSKLQVQNRTEAVARARSLKLL